MRVARSVYVLVIQEHKTQSSVHFLTMALVGCACFVLLGVPNLWVYNLELCKLVKSYCSLLYIINSSYSGDNHHLVVTHHYVATYQHYFLI